MKTFEEQKLMHIGQAIDNQITTDFHARGIIKPIYDVMVSRVGEPLSTYAAKNLYEAIKKPGSIVIIGTGFLITPMMKIETDGPICAALLARAVTLLGGVPIIVAEEECMISLEPACTSAEMNVYYDVQKAIDIHHSVALVPMPRCTDRAAADKVIADLLALKPAAMIDVEHPGKAENGKYYSALGKELAWAGPVDDLFEGVRQQGGYTVGIGDVGNEVGMGFAKPELNDIVPMGKLVTTQGTCDAPIIAVITEYGAYGLIAALEAVTGIKVMHDANLQEIVTRAAVIGGAVEGCSGLAIPALDMVDISYVRSFVHTLECILKYAEIYSSSRRFFINHCRGAALDA